MQCQTLFSRKSKKDANSLSAEFTEKVLKAIMIVV